MTAGLNELSMTIGISELASDAHAASRDIPDYRFHFTDGQLIQLVNWLAPLVAERIRADREPTAPQRRQPRKFHRRISPDECSRAADVRYVSKAGWGMQWNGLISLNRFTLPSNH